MSLQFKMRSHFLFAFLILVHLGSSTFTVDLTKNNKYDNDTLLNTLCNKDTQIDFGFSSSTMMKCSNSSCSLTNANLSSLNLLDITGEDLDLTLDSAQFTTQSFVDGRSSLSFAFTFADSSEKKKVYVIVPVVFSASTDLYVVKLSESDESKLTSLKELTGVSDDFALSTFNFMNLIDYGHFYHVANSQKTSTVLISAWTYQLPNDFSSEAVDSSVPSISFDYSSTADKLCYGSLLNQGIFQTHMRESFPLWTAWFGILFFWLYYLLTDTQTIECYDVAFRENKWTCWGFYSLHYLGHDEYFTKLSRISLMLFNFSWQGLILAGIYSTLGPGSVGTLGASADNGIIIWSAAIALAVSIPIPYLLGGTFLNYIKETTLQKFKVLKKSKGALMENKESEQLFEMEIDAKQERLYGLYYWFYVTIFIGFFTFWTVSIHLMQQLHRDFYELHGYWLGSLAIVFVLDHLVFDVLLTLILGNTRFYRIRGYYYDFNLGQQFKQIEE